MEGTNAFIVNSNERSVAFNDFASWYQQQEAEYNAQLESFKNDENNTGREFNDFYYFFFNKFLINVLSIEQLKCFVSSWKFEILDTSNYSTSELVIFSRNFTAALLLLKVFFRFYPNLDHVRRLDRQEPPRARLPQATLLQQVEKDQRGAAGCPWSQEAWRNCYA